MNKRILLVDCSPKLRQATRDKLEGRGYSVSIATTGADVSTALEEEHFDLVLLEPVIPGLDGFKFCAAIKRDMGSSAPVIVLASRIFRGGRLRTMSRDAGADAHFERPQQDQDLFTALDKFLESAPGAAAAPAAATQSDSIEIPLGDLVEPGPASSLEDEDSLTAMVPEPTLFAGDTPAAEPAADAAPAPADDPPGFDDLSAPQGSAEKDAPGQEEPVPTQNPESATASELPIEPVSNDTGGEDEDSGLHAISEEDIDDALERALGGDTGGSELGGTVFPDDLARGIEETAEPAAQRAVDSPVAFLEDVDPQPEAQGDEKPASASGDSGDEEGFALLDLDDGEDEADMPRRATAAPQIVPQASPEAAPQDALAAAEQGTPTTGAADGDPDADSLVKSPAELDALLEKAFGGEGSGPAGEASTAQKTESASEPPPVPESLQGMDASTADLLSSLAELETSIPGAASGQAWQGADSPEAHANDDPSMPVTPPPAPEDELTLEEIFSRVSSADEGDEASAQASPEAAPVPAGQAESAKVEEIPVEEPVEEVVAAAPEGGAGGEKPKRRGWKKWLLGSMVLGALTLGAAGLGLLPNSTGEDQPTLAAMIPSFDADEADLTGQAGQTEPEISPELEPAPEPSGEERALATLRRPVGNAMSEEPLAGEAEDETPTTPPLTRPRPAQATLRDDPPESEPVAAAEPVASAEPEAAPPAADSAEMTEEAEDRESAEVLLVPLGDLDEPLARLEAPAPDPTRAAIDAGIRARAFVNVLVGSDGQVKSARTMMDPGYGLGEVARQATLGWRYSVPLYEGRPAEVWKTEAVEFDGKASRRR